MRMIFVYLNLWKIELLIFLLQCYSGALSSNYWEKAPGQNWGEMIDQLKVKIGKY